MTLSRSGADLQVKINTTGETIAITNRYYGAAYGYGIERLEFSDGVSWGLSDLLAKAKTLGTAGAETLSGSEYADNIDGLDGADSINGNGGNDIITGGAGNDVLTRSVGRDSYRFARSDGQDVLTGYGDGQDLIEFTGDIGANEIWFQRNANDLLVSILGGDSSIKIEGWYDNKKMQLVETTSRQIDPTGIDRLVELMAGFMPQSGAATSQPLWNELPAVIQTAVNEVWTQRQA